MAEEEFPHAPFPTTPRAVSREEGKTVRVPSNSAPDATLPWHTNAIRLTQSDIDDHRPRLSAFLHLQDPPALEKSMRPRKLTSAFSVFSPSKNPNPDYLPIPYLPSSMQDPRMARAKKKGNEALQIQDWRAAVTAYSEAIAKDPGMKYSKLYFRRGMAFEKLGLLSRAANDYAIAFNLTGGSGALTSYENVYQQLHSSAAGEFADGKAAAVKEKWKLAVSFFTRAIEADGEYGQAYFERGLAYEKLGEHKLALEDIVKAEYRAQVLKMKTACHRALGRIEAKLYLAAAADKRKGDAAFDKLDFKEAILGYSSAIKQCPDYGSLWYNRGLAYERFGDTQRAMADLVHAQKTMVRPDAIRRCVLAMERIQARRHKVALIPKAKGDARFDQLAWADASWWYTRAIKLDSSFGECYLLRGLCRESLGKLAKAERDLKKASELLVREDFQDNCQKALERVQRLKAGKTPLSHQAPRSPVTTPRRLARKRAESLHPPARLTFPELTDSQEGHEGDVVEALALTPAPINENALAETKHLHQRDLSIRPPRDESLNPPSGPCTPLKGGEQSPAGARPLSPGQFLLQPGSPSSKQVREKGPLPPIAGGTPNESNENAQPGEA